VHTAPSDSDVPHSSRDFYFPSPFDLSYLALSKQHAHNPVIFIDQLALSHTVQQDGQEFCRLFMSILDEELQIGDERVRYARRLAYSCALGR
jgi:hypothetical protein